MDPRGFPTSLPEFQRVFPNDAACAAYLEALRWPTGFICPQCDATGEPYRFPKRSSVVLRCRTCKANISLTAGTVMQKTRTPLSTWFWAAYLATTQTPGQSALQFQRQLGLTRYETAFQILHKMRAGMVRPNRDTIGGVHPVEIDEAFIGGRTRGEGKGVHHKTMILGFVEVRANKPDAKRIAKIERALSEGRPVRRQVYAGRIRLVVVPDRLMNTLNRVVPDNVTKGSLIRTDGWAGYNEMTKLGFRHDPLAMNGRPERAEAHLPMIHLIFSNLKTWIQGTHHGIAQQHLQTYLNEFTFRFNRRFYPMTAFNSVLGIAAHTVPPTYAELYAGEHRAA